MGLIERERETNRRRRAESQRLYGHTGATISGEWIDWRTEALSLEEALREYGSHKDGCPAHAGARCQCGYAAALGEESHA